MTGTGRVFVVQRPAYFDRVRRGWVNKYDLTPARRFGELVFLLRPGNIYRDKLHGAIQHLTRELADYGPDDHLLAIGDPVAIAATVMAAARATGGRISLLKFDRMAEEYDAYEIDIAINDG